MIPTLLREGAKLYSYRFSGFWRDIGTIQSYHETSMELLDPEPGFDLLADEFPVRSRENIQPPQYIGPEGCVRECFVGNGSRIFGAAQHSILSINSYIGEGARVRDSVLLPGARVERGATVTRAILGEGAVVAEGASFGSENLDIEIAVAGNGAVVEQ